MLDVHAGEHRGDEGHGGEAPRGGIDEGGAGAEAGEAPADAEERSTGDKRRVDVLARRQVELELESGGTSATAQRRNGTELRRLCKRSRPPIEAAARARGRAAGRPPGCDKRPRRLPTHAADCATCPRQELRLVAPARPQRDSRG